MKRDFDLIRMILLDIEELPPGGSAGAFVYDGIDGFLEVCDEAVQLGMVGGEVKSFNALRYEFAYIDSEGGQVTLNVRSHDPSGPFQNEPDINRFTVKLICAGREMASHDRQYNE